MPFRHLYTGFEDDSINLITPQAFDDDFNNNSFDSAFDNDMNAGEWNDWMKWDGPSIENIAAPITVRRESTTSTISTPETWLNQETADIDMTGSYTTDSFPFGDTSYNYLQTEEIKPSRTGPNTRASSSQMFQPQQRYSSLTAAEERDLQEIAMPHLNFVKMSPLAEASEASISRSPSTEPEKQARKTRKRKSTNDEEGVPSALCQSRKRGHNAIEKRYRTNLNDKINLLREALPTLQRTLTSDSKTTNDEDLDGSDNEDNKANTQKCGKAATLTLALDYIKHLEVAAQRLGDQTGALQTRIGAFEKLAMSGAGLRGASLSAMQPIVPLSDSFENLQSIQAEFTAPKPKAVQSKRRGSKQVKTS